MNYSVTDWVEDAWDCMSLEEDPDASEVRAHLNAKFEKDRSSVPNPEWLTDRILHAVSWVVRHSEDLDTPCVVSDDKVFSTSRYLWEALYRICMRLDDSDLGKEMDLAWVMELAQEQKKLDEKQG